MLIYKVAATNQIFNGHPNVTYNILLNVLTLFVRAIMRRSISKSYLTLHDIGMYEYNGVINQQLQVCFGK